MTIIQDRAMWAMILLFLAILPHSVVSFASTTRTRQKSCYVNKRIRVSRRHAISTSATTTSSPCVQIRDWKKGDGNAIYDILRSAETSGSFNPEGGLEMDCQTEMILAESYNVEDGGCFLVAEILLEESKLVVGTAGLIVGTPIEYQTSGSSMSSPELTAAVRRCVVCPPPSSLPGGIESPSTESIQKLLLDTIEERAVQAKATQLIGLAYPVSKSLSSQGVKPTPEIMQELGYKALAQQLPGVDAVQFGKDLTNQSESSAVSQQQPTNVSPSKESNGLSEIALALVLLVGSIAGGTSLVGQYLGFDTSLSSTVVNRGLGRPLSTEDLGQLMQDEQLQRTTLDDSSESGRSRSGREWEDLSLEERREELALLRVIQGQNVRVK